MSRVLVYAGDHAPLPRVRVLPQFDPGTGFSTREGVVYLSAIVPDIAFAPGSVPPSRLVARAYRESVVGLPLEQIDAYSPVAEGAIEVIGPATHEVPVAGLEHGGTYGFALVAEFPD